LTFLFKKIFFSFKVCYWNQFFFFFNFLISLYYIPSKKPQFNNKSYTF